jgi:hypothetical protein
MKDRTREQLAAATGLVTALLFGISFVIGLSPDPPDLDAPTGQIAAFVVANQDALRVEVLLNTIAMLAFLWFLGSVRAGLRTAEGGAGRVSAVASGGGLVGATFVLLANVAAATATLHPALLGGPSIRLLWDLSAICIGVGAAAFAVFFLAVAVASLMDGGLPSVLGWLALITAALAAVGLATIFSDSGVFAADGAFGYWARYASFIAWIGITSVVLVTSPPKRRGGR